MQPARTVWTVLLACAVSVLGCDDFEAQAWDGKYVPQEERGDWVDSGPLSTCRVVEEGNPVCGSPESFDLTQCKRRTLERLSRQGIFRAELRFERSDFTSQAPPTIRGGGFKLNASGVPELVHGVPAVTGVWNARTILMSGREGGRLYTYVGCNAMNDQVFTGCFSACLNGYLVEAATFRAERMARFKDEVDAAGGLRLRSESFVGLGTPVDVHVAGGHAYVLSRERQGQPGGLTVFDVSDPAAPVEVGVLSPPGGADWRSAVAVEGTLYVATANTGVAVVDISRPSAPTLLGTVPGGPVQVSGVGADADRLYATVESPDEPGTLRFDISTPGRPRLMESTTLDARNPNRLYTGGRVITHEGLLYLNHQHEGLKVADLRDSAGLRLLGRYTYPYSRSAASAVGTFAGRTIAFELGRGTGARLRVLDVSDPGNIQKVSEYGLRYVVSPHDLQLVGTRLYLTYHHEGLRMLDVSNPALPYEVGYYNTFRETDVGRGDGAEEGAAGLHVPGDGHVYVVDTARGLLVLTEPR